MAVTAPRRRVTADEYFALELPRERHTQLVDGEIVVNDPSLRHNRIADELFRVIANWCRAEAERGEAGRGSNVLLDQHNVYVPDVWWVREERRPARDARLFTAAHDLVAEVRSPSTWRYDVGTKKRIYEAAGLLELWLVDTKADTVLVYRRSSPKAAAFDVELELRRGEQLTTPLLPGLSIDLEALFDL